MNSNAFTAADMSTAAANGHAEGYQAGYADAVKAVEAGKSAAAQEAVAWFTDDHLTDRSATTYDAAVAERWRAKGWPVTPLYAAPVAAAPVDGPSIEAAHAMGAKGAPANDAERLAFEAWMRGHCWALSATWSGTGYVSNAEEAGGYCAQAARTRGLWAAWRDRAALSTPAAPGIDLRNAILQLQEDALHMKDPGDTVNAYNRVLALINASPKGGITVVTDAMVNAALRIQYARAGSVWTGTEANPDFVDMRHILNAAIQATSAEVGA